MDGWMEGESRRKEVGGTRGPNVQPRGEGGGQLEGKKEEKR